MDWNQCPVDEEEVPRREAGLTAQGRENRKISGCLQGWPRPSSSPPEMERPIQNRRATGGTKGMRSGRKRHITTAAPITKEGPNQPGREP